MDDNTYRIIDGLIGLLMCCIFLFFFYKLLTKD